MIELEFVLTVLVAGSFIAAICNAAFSAGGALIILAVTSTVLPVTAVVPIHSTLLIGSTSMRAVLFREHIEWRITRPFLIGSAAGAMLGARVYFELPSAIIGAAIALLMLVAIWLPQIQWRPRIPGPWLVTGVLHSLLSTLFAYGAVLQSVILHANLNRHQVVGTVGGCLTGMGVFKISGYAINGFDYGPYLPAIGAAFIASIIGTWLGKQLIDRLSERAFRFALRALITVTALRLAYTSIS